MTEWIKGTVTTNHHWTDQLYSLQIAAKIAPFIAGQFCSLALDIDGKRIARPYSLVNAPFEPYLEFYSIIVPDGPLSTRLMYLTQGDTVWVSNKASGFFTIQEVPSAKHLWLLSTGTAIGPFLSILKTDEPWARFEQIVLVHAVRHAKELSYRETIDQFKQKFPSRFQMVPFVSREETDFAIQGRIPNAIADGLLEEFTGLSMTPTDSQIMLCGNPDMVADTTAVLIKQGFKKNLRRDPGNITMEKYW